MTFRRRKRKALEEITREEAVARRAYDEPPFGQDDCFGWAERESVLLELEPGRFLAIDAESLAKIEQHNKAARRRWLASQHATETRKTKAKKRPDDSPTLGLSMDSNDNR